MPQGDDRRVFLTDFDRFIHDDGPAAVMGDRSIRQRQHDIIFLVRKLVGLMCRCEFFIAPKRHDERSLSLEFRTIPQERTPCQQKTPALPGILIYLLEKVHPCTSKYTFRLYSIRPYFFQVVK